MWQVRVLILVYFFLISVYQRLITNLYVEGGRQKSESRNQKAEIRRRETEGRNQKYKNHSARNIE